MQKEEFKEQFSKYDGSLIDMCKDICQAINNEPEESKKLDLFIITCENFAVKSSRKYALEDAAISDKLRRLETDNADAISTTITSSIKVAISNHYSNKEFYRYLWRVVSSAYQDELLVFALYEILSDRRIPYYAINQGMAMEDSKYSQITQNCLDDINKCRFILDVDFDQKTKEASNLLEVILSHDSKEEQTVILSQVLAYCKFFKLEEIVQALSKKQDTTPKSSESADT